MFRSLQEIVYLTNMQPNVSWNVLQEPTRGIKVPKESNNTQQNNQFVMEPSQNKGNVNDANFFEVEYARNENMNKLSSSELISDDLLEDEIMKPLSSGESLPKKEEEVTKSPSFTLDDSVASNEQTLAQLNIESPVDQKKSKAKKKKEQKWTLKFESDKGTSTQCITHQPLPGSTPSFASGTENGVINVWRLDEDSNDNSMGIIKPHLTFYGHEGPVLCVCVPKATHHIFSGGHDGTIRCWSLPANQTSDSISKILTGSTIFQGHEDCVWELFCHEVKDNNPILLSLSSDGTVRGWKYTGEQLFKIRCDSKQPLSMSVTDSRIAIAYNDGNVRFYDLDTQILVSQMRIAGNSAIGNPAVKDRINKIVWKNGNPDRLYSLHENGMVRVFNVKSEELLAEKSISKVSLTGIAFAVNRPEFAISASDGRVFFLRQDDKLSTLESLPSREAQEEITDSSDILWINSPVDKLEHLIVGCKERISVYDRKYLP